MLLTTVHIYYSWCSALQFYERFWNKYRCSHLHCLCSSYQFFFSLSYLSIILLGQKNIKYTFTQYSEQNKKMFWRWRGDDHFQSLVLSRNMNHQIIWWHLSYGWSIILLCATTNTCGKKHLLSCNKKPMIVFLLILNIRTTCLIGHNK